MRKSIDFGQSGTACFDFENTVRAVGVPDDGNGNLTSMPVFLIDPCQAGDSPLRTATIRQNPGDSIALTAVTLLFSAGIGFAFNNTSYDRIRNANAYDNGLNQGTQTTHVARILNAPAATVAAQALSTVQDLNMAQVHIASGLNAAQTIIIDSRNLSTSLAINVAVNAGAPTFAVSVSVDNTNYLTIDTALAVGPKQYTPTTVGATTALSPLAFRYIKIVIGAAGVGNTSTTDLAMK
jgi:hypothetical protein